jgi:hypothetical protein
MKSLDKAICIASVVSREDLKSILRLATKSSMFSRIKKHAHAEGKFTTTSRRKSKKEADYARHKNMCNILHLAVEIQTAGFLLYTNQDDLKQAKEIAEEVLSEYFNRPFIV